MAPEKEKEEKKVLEPPDGGWGWMVVLASIMNQFTVIPIIQNFGLIYKEKLQDLHLSSTDITTIVSMNSAIGQILGVFQGPLLKKFGYRKMAIFGVFCFTLGTLLTGLSQSFTHFMLTHGLVSSIGFTYSYTSFSMAMNSYFQKGRNRSRASGLLMGFSGLGPVLMPQFVTFSLTNYGVMATAFLLAALNSHGFAAACLLRPIKWYMKEKKLELKEEENNEDEEKLTSSSTKLQVDAESLLGVDPVTGYDLARRRSSGSMSLKPSSRTGSQVSCKRYRSVSGCEEGLRSERVPLRRQSNVQESSLEVLFEGDRSPSPLVSGSIWLYHYDDVGKAMKSTLDLMERIKPAADLASTETLDSISSSKMCEPVILITDTEKEKENRSTEEGHQGYWGKLIAFTKEQFDLDLLQDSVYVVITLGLSIAVIGELIFSLLTPFILYEVGLDLQMAAYFMSLTAVADIIARFVGPYVGELIHWNSRLMYSMALFFLLLSRASLLFVSGAIGLGIVAVAVGFAKGIRSVFWIQVIPDHVPGEKLGSAMSFQNLINGILIFFAGPLAGSIVEINNSYLNIIYVSNALTGATITLWAADYLIQQFKRSKQDSKIIKQNSSIL